MMREWLITLPLCVALLYLAGGALLAQGVAETAVANEGAAASDETQGVEPREGAEKQEEKKDYTLEIEVGAKGVSLHAVNADAQLVFARLAEETGLQIVVDDVVSRKITTRLRDMSASEIVDYLVAGYGLSGLQQDGLFMISEGIPKRPSTYLMSDIEAIPTKYVLAPNAKSLLPVFLQDHVKVNEEQNSVILSAPKDVLRKFRTDVQQFDTPADQIAIDVLMVEFSTTEAEQFESSLTWLSSGHGVSVESLGGDIVFQGRASLGTRFYETLQSLVERGTARVRACPSVATVSGQTASIFIGQERFVSVPIQTATRYGQENSIRAGVRLQMTPWTGGGDTIIVSLSPEVSVMSAPDPVTGLPQLDTRSATATVRVRNGETIVIGGLLQRELRARRTKIPLLGDLPVIGGLFRSKRSEETMTNLVILVTPRILSPSGHRSEQEERALRERVPGLEEPLPVVPGGSAEAVTP